MNFIIRYSKQHQEILVLCEKLLISIATQIDEDISSVREQHERLDKLLLAHLRLEDSVLYPTLSEHKNPQIRNISQRLQEEMKSCTAAYTLYQAKYPNIKSMQENSSSYVNDTKDILDTICKRIEKEDKELYSLLT